MQRVHCHRPAQSLVEFALLLPILTLFMLGSLDLGRVYYTKMALANASRAAAAYATNYPVGRIMTTQQANAKILAIAQQEAGALVTISSATFTGNWQPGSRFVVTTSTSWAPITPLISHLLGGPLTISHATELRHNCSATAPCTYPTPPPVPTTTPAGTPTPTSTPLPPTATATPTITPTVCIVAAVNNASVTSSGNGSNRVTVFSFTTTLAAEAKVEVGPRNGAAGNYSFLSLSAGSGTSHTATYAGQLQSGTYRWIIKVKDSCGNWQTVGPEHTFTI